MPKIGFKTPTRNGIEASATGVTVVFAWLRSKLHRSR